MRGRRRGRLVRHLPLALLFGLTALIPVGEGAGAQVPLRFEATIEPFEASVETSSFPAFDRKGQPLERTRWRVVSGSGNDRENYLASTATGMLLDFGGEWLRFSEDFGRTWSSVLPDEAFRDWYSYEGAVAAAPGGDVVAVGQDSPIDGVLRSLTFKYEAEEELWLYGFAESHFPLVDRPTVGVIPGPITIGSTTVPYISVMRSGLFVKSPFVLSFDGLNYFLPSVRDVDQASSVPRKEPLEVDEWAELDWIQPHELLGLTPYGRGKALAEKPWWGTVGLGEHVPRTVFDPSSLRWSRYDFPSDQGPPQNDVLAETGLVAQGRTLADSDGNLHHVSLGRRSFDYLLSKDGGSSWTKVTVPLPRGYRVEPPLEIQKSFDVSGKFDRSAVVVHAIESDEPLTTRDLLFKLSTAGAAPRLITMHKMGRPGYGCLLGGAEVDGAAAEGVCDFPSVTFLSDGTVALSFTDPDHREPAIAIEVR